MSVIIDSPQFCIAPVSQTVHVVEVIKVRPLTMDELMTNIAVQEATVAIAKRNRDQWKHAIGSGRDAHRAAYARAESLYNKEIGSLHVLRRQRELVPA